MQQPKLNWNRYFLNIAYEVAKKSHCLSRQLGCLVVRDRIILSTGYNGPPMGYRHCEWRDDDGVSQGLGVAPNYTCPRQRKGYKSGEALEQCPATHAEANAIVLAARNGISLKGGTLYGNFHRVPCRECAKLIVNAGIKKIVLDGGEAEPYAQPGLLGVNILEECFVEVYCERS